MFDLFRSRAKAVRYLLGAVLVLVALSMVVTLIPGFGSSAGAEDPVVAVIGGEELTVREVQVNIQAALRGRTIPPDLVATYVPQYINQMIAERALAYQAKRLGFEVTEADLARAIQSAFPQMFQDGKFIGREAYGAFLAQQNLSIPEFESNMRKQMLLTRLRNIALEGVMVTPEEIETEYRKKKEAIRVDFVSFSPDRFRSQVQVTPQEIADRYKNFISSFMVPEKRNLQIIVADESRIAGQLKPSEAELRRTYDDNKDRYRTPERVRVRHILLKTAGKPKEEVAKLKSRIEDLLKQIKGGADFAQLAKKNSEDPVSAAKGGELDWVTRGQTVKNFEDTAFSLKPKELSGVIATEYGFHIVQLLEKQAPHVKPFEEARTELEAELKQQSGNQKMLDLVDQAHDLLVKSPTQAAEIAAKLGLQAVSAEKVSAGDPVPEIGVNQDFQETIRSLQKGQVTPAIQISQSKVVVAVVTDVIPARQAELAEVEPQVRQNVVAEKARELAKKKGQDAAAKMNSVGGDMKKLAQMTGGEFKSTPSFARHEAAEGIGSANYLVEAFAKPAGSVFGPVQVGESFFIVKVTEKIEADMTKLAAERDSFLIEIKKKKASERRELFEDGIVEALTHEGKIKIHENAIRRLMAAYRRG